MFELAGIDHIVLRTENVKTMVNFYCEVLGCTKERETPLKTGLTQLRAGNALIDIVDVDSKLGRMGGGAPTEKDNNLDHFCLQLKPIDEQEIKAYLESHNVNVDSFAERYGALGFGPSVYIHDPDGNLVELKSK